MVQLSAVPLYLVFVTNFVAVTGFPGKISQKLLK